MRQNGFSARVVKTKIVNVDEQSHCLPPDNGSYSEFQVADYYCPEEWSNDGIFVPVKEGDPLWFDFSGNDDECAILCAVQRINPVTGEPADLEAGLSKDPTQNYLRMPEQVWLDGYAKEGKVYQFVVTKAGIGLAVNEFVLPKHMQDSHAIGFAFFGPKNPKPKPLHRTRYPGEYMLTTKGMLKSKGNTWVSAQNLCAGGGEIVEAGGGSQTMNFSPEPSSTMMGIDSEDMLGGSIDVDSPADSVCFLSASAETDKLVLGASADVQRFTQNRVADNYNEVVEEPPVIDTVDILAEEAKLTELDKASMGAGGRIRQEIVTDANTTDYYHEKRSALLTIYFALPEMYKAIMKKGKRQDASKKDKYKTSGHIGGVAVPLVTQDIPQ